MASLCRAAAAAAAARSAALRPATRIPRPFPAASSPAPLLRRPPVAAAAALGSAVSLMPLHSTVAAARLRSCIAADSSCWSCLSQDFALPR